MGSMRDPAFPHVPVDQIFSEATLKEMSGAMSDEWMGVLRKYFGKYISIFLDTQNILMVAFVLIGGVGKCLYSWHIHGFGIGMVKGLLRPAYNLLFFPTKTALRGIDDYLIKRTVREGEDNDQGDDEQQPQDDTGEGMPPQGREDRMVPDGNGDNDGAGGDKDDEERVGGEVMQHQDGPVNLAPKPDEEAQYPPNGIYPHMNQ